MCYESSDMETKRQFFFLGLGVCFHESIALRSDGQTAHVIILTDPVSLLQEWNWKSRLACDMFDVHLERFLWIFV